MGHYALRTHQGLTGAGTLIAIIDTGLDWTHEDFIDENGNTRVAWLLDQTAPATGRYPTLEALGPGAVYSASDIQRALDGESGPIWETAQDVIGHGTHVTGAAASDDLIYSGPAPGARLVIVKAISSDLSGFTEENVLKALAFVKEIARRERRPLVLNLSLGNHMGAHDGSTPIEVALDEMATGENPRIAVVVAAGNERNRAIHARAAACTICLPTRFKLIVPSGAQPTPERPARIVLDFWHSGSGELTVHLITPSGLKTDPIGTLGPYGLDLITDDGIVEAVTSQEPHPINGEHRTTVTLKGEAGQPLATGLWEVVFVGRAERIDGWVGEYDVAGPGEPHFASYVDPTNLVGPPATGLHSIAVGAFVSRNNWQDTEGTQRSRPHKAGSSSPRPRNNLVPVPLLRPPRPPLGLLLRRLAPASNRRRPRPPLRHLGSLPPGRRPPGPDIRKQPRPDRRSTPRRPGSHRHQRLIYRFGSL
jgi:subtilisin family serine protease